MSWISRIFLIVLIVTSSCISKKKLISTKYYLIEAPSKEVKIENAVGKTSLKLEIGPVDVSPAYSSTRIVNRTRKNEIYYYSYHEWAILPKISVQEIAKEYFRSTNFYAEVSERLFESRPDYKLAIHVPKLEISEVTGVPTAHLVVQFRYIAVESGQVVLLHSIDENKNLQEKDLNMMAAAVSNLLWDSLISMNQKIIEYHDKHQDTGSGN